MLITMVHTFFNEGGKILTRELTDILCDDSTGCDEGYDGDDFATEADTNCKMFYMRVTHARFSLNRNI